MLTTDSRNIIIDAHQPLKILPEETITCRVIYKSEKCMGIQPTNEETSIRCKVITGNAAVHELKLNCLCTVLYPSLYVAYNKINFPVVQVEEMFMATTTFKNCSTMPLLFEIFLPYF